MIYFNSDYMEGAHPSVLARLSATNLEKNVGYGSDSYCESAIKKIKELFKTPSADVKFLVGGTQTNKLAIDAIIDSCEGIISAETGHIAVHEAGAIECSGHKVITIPSENGKITAQAVEKYLVDFDNESGNEHCVPPGMVYISFPTEYGTTYTLGEMKEIHTVCKAFNIPLFVDGARLGYGLASTGISPADFAANCDAFYIGGTKVGALFGEALVINTKFARPKHLTTLIKRHGALLAKGWLLGLMFDTLFTDDLYLNISKNAVNQAIKLKSALIDLGFELAIDSPTNQQFVIVEDEKLKALSQEVLYSHWERFDETRSVIRLATSWATTDEQIEELISVMAKYK